jgi:hypothetical protein
MGHLHLHAPVTDEMKVGTPNMPQEEVLMSK